MLGWTKNVGHAGRYDFILYIVGYKSPPVFEEIHGDESVFTSIEPS